MEPFLADTLFIDRKRGKQKSYIAEAADNRSVAIKVGDDASGVSGADVVGYSPPTLAGVVGESLERREAAEARARQYIDLSTAYSSCAPSSDCLVPLLAQETLGSSC